jgi:hypothetical protein
MGSTSIRARIGVVASVALWACGLPVQAESLRCSGGIAAEGDSRLSVAAKCGQPLLKDSFCAPLQDIRTGRTVVDPFSGAGFACQPVDEWLYDRGPGNLMATVRFRSGVVQSIVYGRVPQ